MHKVGSTGLLCSLLKLHSNTGTRGYKSGKKENKRPMVPDERGCTGESRKWLEGFAEGKSRRKETQSENTKKFGEIKLPDALAPGDGWAKTRVANKSE
jgi:hypothetical protein